MLVTNQPSSHGIAAAVFPAVLHGLQPLWLLSGKGQKPVHLRGAAWNLLIEFIWLWLNAKHWHRNADSQILTWVFLGLQCLRNEFVSKTLIAVEWDTLRSAGFKCGYPGAGLAFLLSHWLFPPLCLQSLQKDKMGDAYSEIGMKGEVSLTFLPDENMATENPDGCPGWGDRGCEMGEEQLKEGLVSSAAMVQQHWRFWGMFLQSSLELQVLVSPPWAAEAGCFSRIRRISASPSLCLISDKE